MTHDWRSFLLVVAAQALVLCAVEWARPRWRVEDRHPHSLGEALAVGAAIGLPFGVGFDLVFGATVNVFRYGLSGTAFLLLNALLSYGLAIATAMRLSPVPLVPGQSELTRLRLLLAVLLVAASIGLALPLPALGALLCIGVLVIGAGELIEATWLGTVGPAGEALLGKFARPLRNWAWVAAVGAIYEISNRLWPLWHWDHLGLQGDGALLLVVVLGYVVLMHACRLAGLIGLAIAGQLGLRRGQRSSL
jgi:hypothetical protein